MNAPITTTFDVPVSALAAMGTFRSPAVGTCPVCFGRGEIVGRAHRDPETGIWDEDASTCGRCDGTGRIELRVCEGLDGTCGVSYDPEVEGCQHGESFCEAHKTEHDECRADARAELDELVRHEDPWGGVR